MDEIYSFVCDEGGIRLDKYVSRNCPELSRTQVQKLINDGYIRVNEVAAKPSLKLNTDDRVTVSIPPNPPSSLSPEDIPLTILYEDDDLIAIDKPAGLTVHPAPGHPSHTVVNAILAHFPHLTDIGDSLRPGIVHRLDKDTSGVMLVAKNNTSQTRLMEQFRAHSVRKVYQVLVRGHLTPDTGIIEAPIGRDPANRKRMAVVSQGREARTEYQVIKYLGNHTLLEVKPETGRTHQIRVHFAAIGHPVVADPVYGVKSPYLLRQFMHATRIGFRQPSTGEYIELESELPADLAQALESIA